MYTDVYFINLTNLNLRLNAPTVISIKLYGLGLFFQEGN